MADQPQKPIRAGQAYLDSIRNDPAAQAALRRVQAQMLAFGQALRDAAAPINAVQDQLASVVSESMQAHLELGAALGEALRDCQFDRLRKLVAAYPALKTAADGLEQAALGMRRLDEERRAEIEQRFRGITSSLPDLRSLTPPAFDDPDFWSSITPIGEQIRDAVREAMAARESRRGAVGVPEVAEQLRRYRAAGGPYLDQRTFSKLCGCKSVSTVHKAIKANRDLSEWKIRAIDARSAKAGPRRASENFDIVTDRVGASSETPIPQDDVDTIMKKLSQQAQQNPEWVRALEAMSPDDRAKVAQLYADGDYEPSPLERDEPGKRRKVRHHGRV